MSQHYELAAIIEIVATSAERKLRSGEVRHIVSYLSGLHQGRNGDPRSDDLAVFRGGVAADLEVAVHTMHMSAQDIHQAVAHLTQLIEHLRAKVYLMAGVLTVAFACLAFACGWSWYQLSDQAERAIQTSDPILSGMA